MTTQDLRIADIRTDGGTQMRVQLDLATIAEYTDAMQRGDVFPPVVVFYDGADYWLSEGFHRLDASKHVERETISADVREGSREDAIIAACAANATHGLRRTNADKRNAVETMLKLRPTWSNQEIARRCAVSPSTIATVRESLSLQVGEIDRQVTRNGTTYNVNTSNIGRHDEPAPPAYEPVSAWPMMDVGNDAPAPDADTVTYGDAWADDEEWSDTRSGVTPLAAYIPKVVPQDAPSESEIRRLRTEFERRSPSRAAMPFTDALIKLAQCVLLTPESVDAWLDASPSSDWPSALKTLQRITEWSRDVTAHFEARRRDNLRLVP